MMREEHFIFVKTLWVTNRANMKSLEITIIKKKKLSYYSKIVLFFGCGGWFKIKQTKC